MFNYLNDQTTDLLASKAADMNYLAAKIRADIIEGEESPSIQTKETMRVIAVSGPDAGRLINPIHNQGACMKLSRLKIPAAFFAFFIGSRLMHAWMLRYEP